MNRYYLQLMIFGVLFICSCKQNSKKETKQINSLSIEEKTKSFVFGIDISHYNNNEIDLIEKRKDSLHFIICKATKE